MGDERTSTEAPYRRIVTEIRRRIEAGELRPGDRVPSARGITREWGVAIATATKAHAALRDEGLTISRPGAGTVVAGPVPRREHELSRDRIVRAAVAIADAHGMAELTMRRLAAELDVATMALYRHVPSRDDLVVGMIDVAVGTIRLPPRHPPNWRDGLELCAREEWAAFQRHPWLGPSMSLTRPQAAPNGILLSEWVLAAFDRTTLTAEERMYVQIMLFTFVRGLSSALEIEREAVRETGLTDQQWLETQAGTLTEMIDAGRLTHFRELTEHGFDFGLDRLFEFGLARLLDGIQLFVEARSSTTLP
ncbi:TetR/AcrR family transcriptional regulator C-terminal domain-containing protein [Actinoplanes bogorensis]|uniref:TetR/AcrR family transcriptional regulator C-terminal domain-containing protein n=1 Tax=Paractinoplanes bogorensis TaxID=1610840 RepID=A0ABS5YIA9_9ACTN|nr:TetR/AcrR family transcriptional regulator C-terminal domain-containing protein [Actinoplanes bogorensis]MBU2662781.1 TetR/AcrR family transcriptional regulator C-terminal domain-containing protein [Actinoplanes bogorensis]